MRRLPFFFGLTLTAAVAVGACRREDAPAPAKSNDAGSSAQPAGSLEGRKPTAFRGMRLYGRLPVPADFLPAAAENIHGDNYEDVLDELESNYVAQ